MRHGVRLGLDVGQARIGVAACDPAGTIAFPVATIAARNNRELEVVKLIREYEPIEVLIGHPVTLAGRGSASTAAAMDFAEVLARNPESPTVRLIDERLSTVQAQRRLHESGKSSKKSRQVIDQAAAVVIVQTALDEERTTGTPPGRIVEIA